MKSADPVRVPWVVHGWVVDQDAAMQLPASLWDSKEGRTLSVLSSAVAELVEHFRRHRGRRGTWLLDVEVARSIAPMGEPDFNVVMDLFEPAASLALLRSPSSIMTMQLTMHSRVPRVILLDHRSQLGPKRCVRFVKIVHLATGEEETLVERYGLGAQVDEHRMHQLGRKSV